MTYYQDDTVTLYHGDSLAVLRDLASGSVDCCVTSPPYFGLRDYGVEGQAGAEKSPAEFVERLRELFAGVRRVLSDDGTLWLNLGDSYAADKNLLGIPWRVALELQRDGWILRNAVTWYKPNAMPDPVTDRLAGRCELVFLLTKSRRYWFDLDSVREQYSPDQRPGKRQRPEVQYAPGDRNDATRLGSGNFARDWEKGRNPGDMWTIPPAPFPGAHFAVMPPELARRCIVSGCKPGGTVLDPFSGSGTTGMVAQRNGRKYVGIDLNSDYLDLSLRTRLADQAMEFPA